MKYFSLILLVVISMSFTFGQEQILLIKSADEGHLLRWFPSDFDTWLLGLQQGYDVERSDNGGVFQKINTSTILSKGNPANQSTQLINNVLGIADSIDFIKKEDHGERLLKGIYREYRRMIATEENGIAESGLFYLDASSRDNQSYVYRVRLSNGQLLGEIKNNTARNYPLPELTIIDQEELFTIDWYQDRNWSNFQAFQLEHSQNSRDYSAIDGRWLFPQGWDDALQIKLDSFSMIDSVVLNKSYFYRLVGVDAFGDKIIGKIYQVASKDQTPPAGPIAFDVESFLKEKRMVLNWKKPEKEADFIGYNVYRSLFYDSAFVKINTNFLTVSALSFTDQFSKTEGTFYYKVSAVDKNGNEGMSFTKSAVFPDKIPPAVPNRLAAIIDKNGTVEINWQANKEEDLAGYVLSAARYKEDEFVALTPNAMQSTFFVDTLALNFTNRNYYYKIASQDLMGNLSKFSDPVMVLLPDTIAPIVPILLAPEHKNNELFISWELAEDADLAYSELFRKRPSEEDWTSILKTKSPKQNTTSQPYETSGGWQYIVQAIDSTGNRSRLSNVRYVEFKKETTIEVVSNLSYTALGESGIQLNWEYPTVKAPLFFLILRRTNDEDEPKLLAKVSTLIYVDEHVKQGQEYEYFILAQSSNGQYALPSGSVRVDF